MVGKPFNVLNPDIGPVQKILRLSWPIIVSMALHNAYSITDMYWVSSLGSEAVAAVTLAGILFFVMFAIAQIFATGIHALIARACGAGHTNKAGMILRDGLLAALVTGAFSGFVLWHFPRATLNLLGAEPEVVEIGAPYIVIMAAGFAVTLPHFTLSAAFRATGDMTTAMLITAVSVVFNIILDPILIFGVGPIPSMGLPGAAWATVLSMVIAMVAGVGILRWHHSLNGFRLYHRLSFNVIKEMFVIGLPTGAHYILLSLNQTIMIRMVAEFGTIVLAAVGIGTRITHLALLPSIGIGAATATLVGQYLGANADKTASLHVRRALWINGSITLAVCICIVAFPHLLMRVFTENPQVVSSGGIFLRIFAVSFLFVSTNIVLNRVFQGAGDTLWPAIIACFGLGIFLALGLGVIKLTELGEVGVWLAHAGSSIAQMFFVAWIYRKGTWKRRKLKSV